MGKTIDSLVDVGKKVLIGASLAGMLSCVPHGVRTSVPIDRTGAKVNNEYFKQELLSEIADSLDDATTCQEYNINDQGFYCKTGMFGECLERGHVLAEGGWNSRYVEACVKRANHYDKEVKIRWEDIEKAIPTGTGLVVFKLKNGNEMTIQSPSYFRREKLADRVNKFLQYLKQKPTP